MNKNYAISDLHGQYRLWTQVRDYLDNTDRCYVLGDCIDRGPDGYKILKEVLADDRCLFILGNHEDMMIKYFNTRSISDKILWFDNGGESTYEACKNDSELEKIIANLINAPKMLTYNNIFLTHAGFTPGVDYDNDDLIWDRSHIYDRWWADEKMKIFCVHGHTSVIYIQNFLNWAEEKVKINLKDPQELYYCNGHKIDIDLGSVLTHKTVLLDLDTFESHYFYDK